MPDITLQALNKTGKVEAKGLSMGSNKYWNFGDHWTIYNFPRFRENPIKRLFLAITSKLNLAKHILWADILMWHWDIDWFSYWVVKLSRKKIFVEWIGSDIRLPELLFKINPYYKNAWESGEWEYSQESFTRSNIIQKKFYNLNAHVIVCPEISLFLNKNYFPSNTNYMQRIDLKNYQPKYPSIENKNPILVHTPSATGAKGTKYVRAIIEKLKTEGLQFEYIEIHNKTRAEALAAIHSCDVFIDQFIVGSYGLATCEAMAMGKPVFCFLMKEVEEKLPKHCAIVNTNLNNLESRLREFINDALLRNETGKKSRAFAEEFHDADKIALQLLELFKIEN